MKISVIVGCMLVVSESPIHAYLDPGTGSMVLQVLLGGFGALGVIGKLYWHRVTSLFRSKDKGPPCET
jgi:hypothetical protein